MKKHVSGFLFFFCLTMFCLIGLFWMTRGVEEEQVQKVQATETYEPPLFAEKELQEMNEPGDDRNSGTGRMEDAEHAEETMVHLVLNQEDISHEVIPGKYCLVAEDGYLIVYDTDQETVNMFTHMPLAEFPVKEQERLMEGIWFPTMAEIFSYLESYSS